MPEKEEKLLYPIVVVPFWAGFTTVFHVTLYAETCLGILFFIIFYAFNLSCETYRANL